MKISEQLKNKTRTTSFEVFPPKNDAAYAPVEAAVDALSGFQPDFISVTYGAGGGTSVNTPKIAAHIQNDLKIPALAHLTCASSSKQEIERIVLDLKAKGIENILALRGDLPEGYTPDSNHYQYSFLYRALKKGIDVPVLAGIMPVINKRQIARSCALSGTTLPSRFKVMIDKFSDNPEALKQAGIAYATEQIIDLIANGVNGIHIYTMNRPEVAGAIMHNLSSIL